MKQEIIINTSKYDLITYLLSAHYSPDAFIGTEDIMMIKTEGQFSQILQSCLGLLYQ